MILNVEELEKPEATSVVHHTVQACKEALLDYLQCMSDRNYCQSNIGIINFAALETL